MVFVNINYDLFQERNNGQEKETIIFHLSAPSYTHSGEVRKGFEDYFALEMFIKNYPKERVILELSVDDKSLNSRREILETLILNHNSLLEN